MHAFFREGRIFWIAANRPSSRELDAVTVALVGRWFLHGKGKLIGGDEGIVIPSVDRR